MKKSGTSDNQLDLFLKKSKPVELIYIAHKVSGDVDGNIKDILRIMREIHKNQPQDKIIIPQAPYVVACQYLNDNNPEDRKLGMDANIVHFERRNWNKMYLTGPKISSGMIYEIKLCLKYDIPIHCYESPTHPSLRPQLEVILKDLKK